MQLTRYTDYGIRILMYLAVQPERDALFRIAEVTNVFDLSSNHVAKIIHQLGKLGYLKTIRGKSGGFKLAIPVKDIQIGLLVRQLEHSLIAVNCEEPFCRFTPVCNLKGVLGKAVAAYLAVLDLYSLADIVNNKSELISTLPDLSISVFDMS
ncbi:Rrf2 family transcriptional regulator [Shewanella glacialimarina]|jgi:Rrf2 family nitric oxide-sensitive transcriptional repressor|uniref:Rrf2 family transcriptional regulator n=1 Tax=Shewanella glacialimarina TaxID=2590884 RepID=UPI001CF8E16A|nr:Rrf2 family transcriptional regulator [Shewanella glacialimarina]UCX06456.1 Rrf2 family transcriptional regulator [Shewanella glacialimarina]